MRNRAQSEYGLEGFLPAGTGAGMAGPNLGRGVLPGTEEGPNFAVVRLARRTGRRLRRPLRSNFSVHLDAPEEKANGVQPRQSDQGVDDPAEAGGLPAEEVGHQIVAEEPDQEPVQRADNHEHQR